MKNAKHSFLGLAKGALLLLFPLTVLAGPFDDALLVGVTDKAPDAYKCGEKMKFTLSLEKIAGLPDGEWFVAWTRTGDDGKTEKGKAPAKVGKVTEVVTSLASPGFVRLEAYLVDAAGKRVKRDKNAPGENWFGEKDVFFDGGAAADIAKIRQGAKEPADFDAFWKRQKAELAKVPMKVKRWEVKSPNPKVRVYGVQVDSAGGRPVTGYLSIPKRCEGGTKLGARLEFDGYGTGIQRAPKHCWFEWQINFHINAHGYDLEQEGDYYKKFFEAIKSNGKGYALDPVQNSDPKKAYFLGMTLRVLRALEYVKSLPEWNGRELEVSGGSQGGLQTVWAAALDKDVTKASPQIIWCCDIGKRGKGRMRSTFEPGYTDALRYFDCVNMAKRITCAVEVPRAGLGDYVSPPSGIAVFANNLTKAKSKKVNWVQGSRHGYVPPKK